MIALRVAANDTKGAELTSPAIQLAGRRCVAIRLPLASPIEVLARQRLANTCRYAFYFQQFTVAFARGVLVQERLFEPFFTTKSKGTGLGMAISQRFARGRIVAANGQSGARKLVATGCPEKEQ